MSDKADTKRFLHYVLDNKPPAPEVKLEGEPKPNAEIESRREIRSLFPNVAGLTEAQLCVTFPFVKIEDSETQLSLLQRRVQIQMARYPRFEALEYLCMEAHLDLTTDRLAQYQVAQSARSADFKERYINLLTDILHPHVSAWADNHGGSLATAYTVDYQKSALKMKTYTGVGLFFAAAALKVCAAIVDKLPSEQSLAPRS